MKDPKTTMPLSRILFVGLLAATVVSPLAHVQSGQLDAGYPGLKIVLAPAGAVAIYADEPKTVGVGLRGGMKTRHIKVLFDQGYGFDQRAMDIPEQLYPLDSDTAFTSTGGAFRLDPPRWDLPKRTATGYRLIDGQLTVIPDALAVASSKYRLERNESFLGRIDNRVFFWRDFNPTMLFWREIDSEQVYGVQMPKGMIDLYGVTRGVKKDIGLVALRKSPGLIHITPNTHDFLEFSISAGKPVASP